MRRQKFSWYSPISLVALVIITLQLLLQPYAVLANPGWTLQTADSTTGAGAFTSIALDSNGYPHIAYCNEGFHRLWYTRWNGTSWDTPNIVDSVGGDVGWFTSIAIDSNDHPHISYYDNTNTSLKYAYYDGTWHTETVDNTGEVAVYGTSLALDNSNHPHISYMIRGGLVDLKYARHDGTSWNIETVDSADAVGFYSSLALDSSYYPHISYIDRTNNKLKYARWTGTAWDIQTLYDIDASDIEWPAYNKHTSIALDSSGHAHISYYKPSGLWYTRYNGTAWTEEKVAGSGKYNRLALDSNNYPHINFQSSDELNLRYARFDGTSWIMETVDSSPEPLRHAGQFSAIVLDLYGYPYISYQCFQGNLASGKYVLKYARYIGPPVINTANPAQGYVGSTLNVTLAGYSFNNASAVSFGTGITVNSFVVDSDTQITVNITIASDAIPGTRNISVTTPEGTGTKNNGFTVLQPTQSVNTATGTGTATFTTSDGSITDLTALATTPCGTLSGFNFPHGFFSFIITSIPTGSAVTITITLPSAMPTNTQYWKCVNGQWVNVTSLLGDNDGDNVLTLTIIDGGLGDADGDANGTIVDPGGPAVPGVPTAAATSPGPRASPTPPRPLNPPQMSAQYLSINPQQASANQPVTITTNVVNIGDEGGNYNLVLKINGQVEQTKMASVGPHGTQPVKFTVARAQPGTYTVDIAGQKGSFTILGAGGTSKASASDGLIIILILGVLVIASILIVLATFRRPA